MPFKPIIDPTPDEIEAGCAKIRPLKEAEQERQRQKAAEQGWTPPIVHDFDPWALIDSYYRDF